ncbi:MAG: serine/threonine protein kinase, partial [Thermodesulfobacteriota bacterium]
YIVAGGTTPASSTVSDVFLLKLDANGGVVWQKTYGEINDDVAYSVQQTSDGGYIVAGKSSSFGNFFGDMWVLKVKSNGDIDWQKTYGGNDSNSANFIRQISDGGYVLAGETLSFGAGDADAWVLRLDANGNISSGCTILADSNGTVTTSAMTAADSSATATITTATATLTSLSPNDSGATTTTQCSSP